jgi:hypothetical protein
MESGMAAHQQLVQLSSVEIGAEANTGECRQGVACVAERQAHHQGPPSSYALREVPAEVSRTPNLPTGAELPPESADRGIEPASPRLPSDREPSLRRRTA